MTGIRSCNSAIAPFGSQVMTVHVTISSPLLGDFQVSHRPAITIGLSSAVPISNAPFAELLKLSQTSIGEGLHAAHTRAVLGGSERVIGAGVVKIPFARSIRVESRTTGVTF